MGSLWTFWYALDNPSKVDKMIHIGCPAMLYGSKTPLPMRLLGLPLIGSIINRLNPPTKETIEGTFSAMGENKALKENPILGEAWLTAERLPNFDKAWRNLLGSILNINGPYQEALLTPNLLKTVEQPTLLIWGENETFGSIETGKHAASIMKNSRFSVVEGGHLPWLVAVWQVVILRLVWL